ncbi:hypothetical protein [Thalassoroseus pseudoceratinae]|uniref:hypothetical protein n=1 Tax=Thalassoroseus pseudoceratinae TaxID=2713176 RepID=UPI00141F76A7|nr:hypothetical protein [Thalassoroseus pseudoceratinae]
MSYSKRCKKNGIKIELTWFAPRKKWKSSKGVSDGFPVWYSKGDDTRHDTKAGYEAALHEWIIEKAKRDAERPNASVWHLHKALFEQVRDCCHEPQLSKDVSKFLDSIENVLSRPELPDRIGIGGLSDRFRAEFVGVKAEKKSGVEAMLPTTLGGTSFGTLNYQLPEKWQHILELHATTGVNRPQTVKYWAERYLDSLQEKAAVNQRSPKTYTSAKSHLAKFRSYIGDESHITSITGVRWQDFYSMLLNDRELKVGSKMSYRRAAITFTEWAWRQDECELETLPKNLKDRSMTFVNIEIDDNDEVDAEDDFDPRMFWEKDDFTATLASDELNNHWKCWLLLFLNCGFTQTDVNDIRHRQLNLKDGRLIHKRTKTKRTPNPPRVNYKLWPSTIAAIKKVICKDNKFAFLTVRGGRLTPKKTETTKDGELKTIQYDNVSRMWGQMKSRGVDLPDRVLKGLRKTGAATIKEYDLSMRKLYLGHSGDIADKNYDPTSGRPYQPLDDAIDYLGSRYGQCDPPAQKVTLTAEMVKTLQEAGHMI